MRSFKDHVKITKCFTPSQKLPIYQQEILGVKYYSQNFIKFSLTGGGVRIKIAISQYVILAVYFLHRNKRYRMRAPIYFQVNK